MEPLKQQIQEKIGEITRHLIKVGRPGAHILIGELRAIVGQLPPELYKKGKDEKEITLDFHGMNIEVFFDYQPEEPPVYYGDNAHPGCPEDVTINHKEILNDAALEVAILDEIAMQCKTAIEEHDYYHNKAMDFGRYDY